MASSSQSIQNNRTIGNVPEPLSTRGSIACPVLLANGAIKRTWTSKAPRQNVAYRSSTDAACPYQDRPPKQTVVAHKITSGKTVLPAAMRWTRNCGERSHSAVVGERSPCVWCLRLPGLLVARAKNVAEISPAQQRRGWRGKPGINVTM